MNATKEELIRLRDQKMARLAEIQSDTVHKLVVHKDERKRLNEELDEIEIALDEMD